MAVKVGNSWVSEAAYAYAQGRASNNSEDKGMLKQLSVQFPDIKFTTNTSPYSGSGKNNMAIAPNILREMENNPEKRMEYEALIYDCQSAQKSMRNDRNVISQGFILNNDGSLGAWSISKSGSGNSRQYFRMDKNDKGSWLNRILNKRLEKPSEKPRSFRLDIKV